MAGEIQLPPQTWMNQLPQAQTPEQQMNARLLAERLRALQQENQGYNAMGQLFANPSNLQGGLPTQNAIAGLMQQFPRQGMQLLEFQSKLQQQQMQSRAAQQNYLNKEQENLLHEYEPLVSQYDADVKKVGPEQALRNFQQSYSDTTDRVKSSGTFSPQVVGRIPNNGDPERLRTNILGLQGIQSREKEEREAKHQATQDTLTEEQRILQASGFVGKVRQPDGSVKEQQIRQGGPTGYMDVTGKPIPTGDVYGVHKMATKGEEDAAEMGKPTVPDAPSGPDYLGSLDQTRASQIKGYAEGRLSLPGSFSMKSPFWIKMLADIQKYDPSFEQADFQRRLQVRNTFTKGPEARNVTSFNTALGHFGNLMRSADELLNSEMLPGFKPANWLEQTVRGVTGADARQKKFATDALALAEELERAFRGTGGNVTSILEWKNKLNSIDTPTTMHAVIQEAADLLGSRIAALQDQYRRGMGPAAQIGDLFTAKARSIYDAIERGETPPHMSPTAEPTGTARQNTAPAGEYIEPPGSGAAPRSAPAGQGNAPPIMRGADGVFLPGTPEEAAKLPKGSRFRRPDDPPGSYREMP